MNISRANKSISLLFNIPMSPLHLLFSLNPKAADFLYLTLKNKTCDYKHGSAMLNSNFPYVKFNKFFNVSWR